MTRLAISAIIVSYHTGPRLKECLFALAADPDVAELIIIDNGNPPETEAWLEEFAAGRGGTVLLQGHGNIGFGAAINRGAEAAASPHLLVINPDAVLRRGSLSGMQDAAAQCDTPWIVGGKIFNLFGIEERGPRRRELTLLRAVTGALGWNTWTLERTPSPVGPIDMPVISGAFFLTSKESMDALQGFDEGYFLHVEDVDLCRRCRMVGGRVLYDPRAGALHYGATSDVSNRTVSGHKADSLARYFRKFAENPLHRIVIELTLPFMRLAAWLRL